MNIFRILSSNDGSINEPNVSSFLAYLLDPNEDHGFSSLLLQSFLNKIVAVDNEFLKKIQFVGKITDLSKSSGYSINILPELTVNIESKKKRRDIDIVLEIIEDKTKEILYSICLENKITDLSISKNDSQLEDELNGLEAYYNEIGIKPEIYVIYLTPTPSYIAMQSFDKLEYKRKCHLFWNKADDSVFNMLLKIFNDENNGLIDPINNQSSYLIKSFLSFINTDFKSYIEEKKEKLEKKNYGKPVIDLLNDFANTLSFENEYQLENIKKDFSSYVKINTEKDLVKNTRDAHINLSIVNEKNRAHYNVKKPDDVRKNVFYYVDDSKRTIKRFKLENNSNVKIFFNDEGEIRYIDSDELRIKNLE
ncbi:MAG: PD-(D/E)XK nuclease family protein [Flavobacterium sp.]|uniref:PD-(D/E)XK nuclease family protein n=1 Tax=Flavobacterium sp. TaxID=239 RepID=UPI002625564A|nr:PD-(D/E)XK nuclease family protein [Flavobacterium sp.]MDD5149576.1 PD-(D/E)XK nuclease family protein [Flavobacterium sp.]